MADGPLAAAVAASLADQGITHSAATPTPDATGTPEGAGEGLVVDPGSEGAEPTGTVTSPEAQEGTADEDVPTEYFGVDLSGLDADTRREMLAQWAERDRIINQLQREKTAPAAPEPVVVAPQAPATPVAATDEELALALGLDMEDDDDQRTAKTAVPLARLVLDLKAQVENLSTSTSADATERYWVSTLDKLEAENIPLADRVPLYEFAVEHNIGDPEAAYWAFIGPRQRETLQAVQARLAADKLAGKRGATTPRPRGSEPVVPVALTSKDTKDAVLEAAQLAAQELGIDWEAARKSQLRIE